MPIFKSNKTSKHPRTASATPHIGKSTENHRLTDIVVGFSGAYCTTTQRERFNASNLKNAASPFANPMPCAILQKEIEKLDESQQDTVVMFVRFLLSQKNASAKSSVFDNKHADGQTQSKIINRKLGGFEKGFYIAPDFDAPLDDFAEYM